MTLRTKKTLIKKVLIKIYGVIVVLVVASIGMLLGLGTIYLLITNRGTESWHEFFSFWF